MSLDATIKSATKWTIWKTWRQNSGRKGYLSVLGLSTVQDWMGEWIQSVSGFGYSPFSLEAAVSILSRYTLSEHKRKAYMKWSRKLKQSTEVSDKMPKVHQHSHQKWLQVLIKSNTQVFSPSEHKVSLQHRRCWWGGCGTEKISVVTCLTALWAKPALTVASRAPIKPEFVKAKKQLQTRNSLITKWS